MRYVTKVLAKIISDRERAKSNPSKEEIKRGLRRRGNDDDNSYTPSPTTPNSPEKEAPEYSKKRGNVLVPKAFLKKIGELGDKFLSDEAKKIAKTGWISPERAESLLARVPEGKERKFLADLLNRAHDEPYLGSSHNIQWRSSDKHAFEDKLPHPMPQQVKDLKGTLGKDVPSGGADPFMWMDSKYEVTKNLLKNHYNKPLTINTRSDLIAHDDYMENLNLKKHKVRIHVLTDDSDISRILEPGAPSFKRRLDAAKKLSDAGYNVTIVLDVLDHPKLPSSLKKRLGSQLKIKRHAGKIKVEENKVKLTDQALDKIVKVTGIAA